MDGWLSIVLNVAVLVFAVSSMFSAGLGHRLEQVLGPLRDPISVLRVLLANFVLVPLLAYVVIRALAPPTPLAVGLFLVATAAGAPFLIKLTAAAEADIRLSTALLVLLLPATIVYMPIVVPLAVPEADVNAMAIARPLVVTMLLPLALGLVIRQYRKSWALAVLPSLGKLSSITLIVLITSTVLANLPGIRRTFETSAVVAALILVAGAFFIGFLVGGPGLKRREVLGLGSGQRNISAATVVATQAFDDPNVVTMVIVASLVGFAVLFPVAWVLRRNPLAESPSFGAGPRRPGEV